jgi:16S rRNA (cytosine1402-N4)-methyltransferase
MDCLGKVDGVLLDLGVSSPQIDDASRGFSFQKDGKLDMRMNTESGITAAEWVATVKEQEMVRIFREYGEERFAKRIARAIVSAREFTPITHTRQLAGIIAAANPAWEKGKDPATRCFQAIRIYLNQELEELQEFLENIPNVLADKGRLVVISFHSLEDRVVKRYINKESKGDDFPRDLPVTHDMLKPRIRKVGKRLRASAAEIERNPRARSAVMRVAEKIAAV